MTRANGNPAGGAQTAHAATAAARLFAGPGEMRARGRALDWAATPLGPVEGWPQSLRTAVSLCLASGFPKLVMWGPELVQLYNDAFRSVLQAKHPAGLGQRARDCWPELWEMIGPMYHGVLETGESVFLEDQLFAPERRGEPGVAEEAYFTFSYSAIPDASYRPAGILATTIETTRHIRSRGERERALERANAELRAAAAALGARDAQYRTLFESIDQGFCTIEVALDAAGRAVDYRFLEVSPSFERQTGIVNGAGRWMREIAPDQDDHWFERYGRIARTGVAERFEEGSAPLGRWWNLYAFRVGDPALRRVGVLFHDITERKVAEAERERLLAAERAARADAEAANRAKSEFLAVMSHELRTPLNAIGGYAELIELGIHGPVTDAQRTALERIQRSQRHLLGLIAGVLDYSRVEAGAVTYQLADVPVTEAVAEAEALIAPQLRAKGLGYSWSGAPPGRRVRADREKLQQILLNLLGNAVKFTHGRDGVLGRIEVACTTDPREGDAGTARVHLHVRDTGEGIEAAQLGRIFEPFIQADQRLTRPHAGVGLGLAISRDLARGMGGELTVESTPGVGSVFTLSLPRSSTPGS